ncbi:Maternal embryonic leucine zipper kinase [Dirofilaria immitis]|nr:Maternal embryonic leucine zipper kinase [Dirofilaria immitis]
MNFSPFIGIPHLNCRPQHTQTIAKQVITKEQTLNSGKRRPLNRTLGVIHMCCNTFYKALPTLTNSTLQRSLWISSKLSNSEANFKQFLWCIGSVVNRKISGVYLRYIYGKRVYWERVCVMVMLVASFHNSVTTDNNDLAFTSPYAALEGLYALHDELGSGGFGKVRLATHLLTSQKVAIKIIDKFRIKERPSHFYPFKNKAIRPIQNPPTEWL